MLFARLFWRERGVVGLFTGYLLWLWCLCGCLPSVRAPGFGPLWVCLLGYFQLFAEYLRPAESWVVRQLAGNVVYTILNHSRASFRLWWEENLVKHQGVSKYYEMIVCKISISSLCLYWWLGLLGTTVGGFGGLGRDGVGGCFRWQSFTGYLRPVPVFNFSMGWCAAACFLVSWDPEFWVVRRVVGQHLYTMLLNNNHTYFYIPCL